MDNDLAFEGGIYSLYTHLLLHINFFSSLLHRLHLHRRRSEFQGGDKCSPQGLKKAHGHLLVYLCCLLRLQHSCKANSNFMGSGY